MVFSALWEYRTVVKSSAGFTPFQLVYRVEVVLPIECEIPNIHISIELLTDTQPLEQRLVQLDLIDEIWQESLQKNEAHKKRVKASFDYNITPRSFFEGEVVLC